MTPPGALPSGLGRDALLAEVRSVCNAALPHGGCVLLAVSGGPDSTALAYLVTEARPDLDTVVAHVRHGLRDDADDAAVAQEHADALGLAYEEREVRVQERGEGVEAAARQARYAALTRIAHRIQARAVLVGHTADDQAETVLLNVARGAGLGGLAGMRTTRDEFEGEDAALGIRVVRPLLRLRREDVRGFVAGEGLRAISDPTNVDLQRRRARVRHQVLPALASLVGGPGDPVGALTRLADLARDDAEALDQLAAEHARRLVRVWGAARAVPRDRLAALPRALASRVVRLLLRGVRGRVTDVDAATVSAVLGLEPGQALHVSGGVWMTAGGGWLAAAPGDLAELEARWVAVPGTTPLPELGLAIHAETVSGEAGEDGDTLPLGPAVWRDPGPPAGPLGPLPPGAEGPAWALVRDPGGLAVRARRPGDRIGGVPLADLLSEAGIPRALRGLVPVLVGPDGAPCWIPGLPAPAAPPSGPALRLWLGPAV